MTDILPAELTHLKFIPSYDCARGCFYCYNGLLNQRLELGDVPLRGRLDELLSAATRPVTVEIIGGEPLQKPALHSTVALLEQARANARCSRTVLSTAVSSGPALMRVLPLVDLLYLSIDTSRDARNRKRISDWHLLDLVDACRRHGTDLFVSTVLFGDETRDELEEFVLRLRNAGVPAVGFTHLRSSELATAEIETAIMQYHHLFRLRLALRRELLIAGAVLDSIELHMRGGCRTDACECARNSLVVEPDGTTSMGLCFDHESLRPTKVEELRDIKDRRRAYLMAGPCAGCRLWDVCQGGCVSEGHRSSGNPLDRAEMWCAILLGIAARVETDLSRALPAPT